MIECSLNSFGEYLSKPFSGFSIDLSNSPLIECIDRLIEVKKAMSPMYGKKFSCLKYNLRMIENDFGCKLMPYHITDIFWYNFIPYLTITPSTVIVIF